MALCLLDFNGMVCMEIFPYFEYGIWKTELKVKGLTFAYSHLFVSISRKEKILHCLEKLTFCDVMVQHIGFSVAVPFFFFKKTPYLNRKPTVYQHLRKLRWWSRFCKFSATNIEVLGKIRLSLHGLRLIHT